MSTLARFWSLLLLLLAPGALHGCVDEQGRPLDFFLIYKVPKLENSPDREVRTGYGYGFLSANSANKWQLSSRSINDPKSLLGNTLDALFRKSRASGSATNFLVYNDQPPKGYNASRASAAHSKGIFVLNGTNGFYLSHSVPRFPDLQRNNFEYPESGRENGQVLICISLSVKDSESVANIGSHLLLLKPHIYANHFTDAFLEKYPAFKDLIARKWSKNQTQISTVYSNKRVKFTLFSKSNKFQKDIYAQLIAPHVKEDLLVQTWRNGAGGKLESDCKDQFKIMNIDEIRIQSNIDWKATEDHGKWAVSVPSSKDKPALTCVSDLNRMRSQFNRGGGSICLQSPSMWSIFNSSVESIEPCPLNRKPNRNKLPTGA